MLTLFSNRRDMEQAYNVVEPQLRKSGLYLACQKRGVSVKGVRDTFLADKTSSLFALKSFWEGFDAPGATLRGVVIPKIPFMRPSDPLLKELDARSQNGWATKSLPSAVIDIKQAAGRLIRTSQDKGCVIFADVRVANKGYGKTILASMPTKNIRILPCDAIVQEIAQANQHTAKNGSSAVE